MTPLIDVTFLLIIFFMIISNFISEQSVEMIVPGLTESTARELESPRRVVVNVAPGTYVVAAPVRLDVPGLELRGSNAMRVEPITGWPTGEVEPGTNTLVTVAQPLSGTNPIFFVTADDVTVTGLTFGLPISSARGGVAVFVDRVQSFTLSNNLVTGGAFLGFRSAASSGTISDNYITGNVCGHR